MKKKRILLVDDEVGFTRLLKLNLEQVGLYEVRIENGADHALNAAQEFRPDLILMDVIMPHVPGVELAATLRADAELGRTPIVFLTATVSRGDDPRSTGGWTRPCIAKPASIDEVIDGIEGNLADNRCDDDAEHGDCTGPPTWNAEAAPFPPRQPPTTGDARRRHAPQPPQPQTHDEKEAHSDYRRRSRLRPTP